MQKTLVALAVLVVAVAVGSAGLVLMDEGVADAGDVSTFSSADEFRKYLDSASENAVNIGDSVPTRRTSRTWNDTASLEADAAQGGVGGAPTSYDVDRESDTNVQVEGIDEPDILKTGDGRLFYSGGDETKVVDALPPANMSVSENLSGSGDMLHEDGRLVSLNGDEMVGYGVDGAPERDWSASLNSSIHEARLYDGTVYAVLSDDVNRERPCPIRPMSAPSGDVVVPCEDIHRPDEPTNVDTTYTVVAVDASSGEVTGRTSFVGSAANSVVYVSRDAVYVTYTRAESEADIILDFALSDGRDIFDDATLERIERLDGYELSDRARRVELESILDDWRDSLDEDERIEAENELENRMRDYVNDNLRDFETTQVVRVNTEGFEVDATGSVPGAPLNQFALDEHDDSLRVATTVGESLSLPSVESENDVYVLNDNLERTGSAQGMGEGQRVYSVRFVGDTGYVVTYRQVDPFYVLDLSNPEAPSVEGELKLPGYSSYLHPLGDDRVLGVGEEDGRVKATVFGVSDPTDPRVEDDYILDEYSSDAVGNHRAFLHDERHDAFFLPGSQAGYVFTYDDGLELEKAVNITNAQRAAYINDYLYVVSDHEVVALDENDWTRAGRIEIGSREPTPYPRRPVEPTPEPTPDVERDTQGGGSAP
ncbi:MAG: beta-propeller domain-containing protein [Halobacteriales archaeon]